MTKRVPCFPASCLKLQAGCRTLSRLCRELTVFPESLAPSFSACQEDLWHNTNTNTYNTWSGCGLRNQSQRVCFSMHMGKARLRNLEAVCEFVRERDSAVGRAPMLRQLAAVVWIRSSRLQPSPTSRTPTRGEATWK